ncbi:hypothetical protein ACTWQB_00420 [Piscibacillus sp. B03]|uniref:hypothetical protein n=1 Tax=Piscibacillus sp. B03 TaxID=3457430 RepID=UPI003FCCD397
MKKLLGIAVITALIVGFSLNVSAGDLNDSAMQVELMAKKGNGEDDLGAMD